MVLDGAMGTMIQHLNLVEADFRGDILADHPTRLTGNNDLLSLTRPKHIASIHRAYLEAGADIIETNTFSAQTISQSEYGTQAFAAPINAAAARIARSEADRMTRLTPDKPRFVAGSIGPTGKTASMSPDVDDPAMRAIDFDRLCQAYTEQMQALLDGGVDLFLIETIFDTLNTKAALEAARTVFATTGKAVPVMLSVTIADAAGRTLSGQTVDAFITSTAHAHVFSIGLNCSFGADRMLPFLRQVAAMAPCYVSAYPNAGIPDAMGRYNETPESMARNIGRFADEHLVNIVGGCCGSTPDHIRAIARTVSRRESVRTPHPTRIPWLAGLDGFNANGAFINIGERCNVAGSRKFLRLINEKNYDEALSIARKQVRDGAMVIDINMDDGMLDATAEMTHFLNLMASDPEVARLPWMVDSSRFDVIEAALKCIQGKAIVNSVSLKEGETVFLERARRVRDLGAALIVMAFDEEGQATSYERKIAVCSRAYHLLVDKLDFDPNDIIFDPNVLTIATGMKEHDGYALDFIRATRWIHDNLPGAKVSGGVSNLSFSFRGNNYLREAMHAVFLFHAIRAGLDMGIVNPASKVMYADIPKDLLEALEDAVLHRRDDATERLVDIAAQYKDKKAGTTDAAVAVDRHTLPLEERLITALKQGDEEYLEADVNEALAAYPSAQSIIEGPLMKGMSEVGDLFGAGKMFLPQVVKTARTMKHAVAILQPHIMAGRNEGTSTKSGNYLIATVKGDVHDIGKNIVGVVMACNNFDVTDLGVMVPPERIVEAARDGKADFIALSGLITPSLDEMCKTADALRKAGINVPLFVGGATTSALHTAVKIAPLYDGPVFHVKDAAQNPVIAMQLMGAERDHVIACLRFEQEQLRQRMQRTVDTSLTEEQALERRHKIDWSNERITTPTFLGARCIDNISIDDIRPFVSWIHFLHVWGVRRGTDEATMMRDEAERLLDEIASVHSLRAEVAFYRAYGTDDSIVIDTSHDHARCCCGAQHEGCDATVVIPTPRQRKAGATGVCRSLCDYVAPQGYNDHIGAFAVTIDRTFIAHIERLKHDGDRYASLLLQSLADRLAEAAAEWLHAEVRRSLWGYAPDERLTVKEMYKARYDGIRPAVGYPSLPDQKTIFRLARLVNFDAIDIRLTENGAMYPQASVCGLYIANRHADYFLI